MLRERLLACGALFACMSGSGSAVFGIFDSEAAAEVAHEQLAGRLPWVAVTRLPQGDAGARIKP
jgi:4-diphosphocytidyl-2C-methyl-D-erythritol kinase